MQLKERLLADVATAMRQGDTETRDALRLLLAAIKQVEVDSRTTLDDAGVQTVLVKQAKQRRESIADFKRAGRPEQVAKEEAELAIIESYLPEQMSREEIELLASEVVSELGVTDIKSMGQVMGALMPRIKGRADGRLVSEVVRQLLQRAR